MNTRRYISTLMGIFFLFALLLSGCAKDELMPPASEIDIDKSAQVSDKHSDDNEDYEYLRNDSDQEDDEITDDEDDEEDDNRTVNR